ncbi:MAG: hypothetical protein V1731_01560 [Candidatus Aenigmatarchaeota archaeon]
MFWKKDEEKIKDKIQNIDIPDEEFLSHEFRVFMDEEKNATLKLSAFERACNFCEKIIKVEPGKSTQESMGQAIEFAGLRCTPASVTSLSAISIVLLLMFSLTTILLEIVPVPAGLVMVVFSLLFGLYIYNYPSTKSREFRVKASEEIVLSVVYMVIAMRLAPNLESAIKFAAVNLTGPLAKDYRKVLWDIYMRRYESAEESLKEYTNKKWKNENQEFVSAINLVVNSINEPEQKRNAMLDEAIDVVLAGTKERMKHYAQNLRTPVLIIHALGILLPIMGLVLFPVLILFLSDVIKPYILFMLYDIVLAVFLWWYIDYTLSSKPQSLSKPDVSRHPGMPKIGCFRMSIFGYKYDMPTILPTLIVFLTFLWIGLNGLAPSETSSFMRVMYSTLIISGTGIAIAFYCYASSFQRVSIRDQVVSVESEFGEAIFQLGNQLASGIPIERAVETSQEKIRNLKISSFFEMITNNIKRMGMTFEQAVFDRNYGAVWNYPSALIISVMKVIVEASKKGVFVASSSMMSIAKYLKDVHIIEEDMREILGETTSSMKFLSAFLAPLVAGVTVTMGLVMLDIIKVLGEKLGQLPSGGSLPLMSVVNFGQASVSSEVFQMIVGIYMLEVILLTSTFISKVESGEDKIAAYSVTSKNIFVGLIVYTLTIAFVYSIFGNQIQNLLVGGLV